MDPFAFNPITIVIALLTGFYGKALVYTPRDVRAHDRNIRHLAEDVLDRIDREDRQLRGKLFMLDLEYYGPKTKPRYMVARDKERAKRAASKRFEKVQTKAIRRWEAVRDDEQVHHRVYRWARRRPLPGLPHSEMFDAFSRWSEPEEPTELDDEMKRVFAQMKVRNTKKAA